MANLLSRQTSKIAAAGARCQDLRRLVSRNSLRQSAPAHLRPQPAMRPIAPLLILALLSTPAAAQMVEARGGDVYFRPGCDLPARRLTASGSDSQPRLSPDGRLVVFVREARRDSVETAQGRVPASSIWIVRTGGGGLRKLVEARSDTAPERALAAFQAPQFSPDGRRIYFLSSAWATSGAVHFVDVASGARRFLVPGNSLEVATTGRYAGHLLVEQHRYFVAGGSYDWLWLFTPLGREVGPVAESEAAAEEFRATFLRRPGAECPAD